jgi:hypothetical protein
MGILQAEGHFTGRTTSTQCAPSRRTFQELLLGNPFRWTSKPAVWAGDERFYLRSRWACNARRFGIAAFGIWPGFCANSTPLSV